MAGLLAAQSAKVEAADTPPCLSSMPPELIQAIVKVVLGSRTAEDTATAARLCFTSKFLLEASRGAWLASASADTTNDLVAKCTSNIVKCVCGRLVWKTDCVFCNCFSKCGWHCRSCIQRKLCATCGEFSIEVDSNRPECLPCMAGKLRHGETSHVWYDVLDHLRA